MKKYSLSTLRNFKKDELIRHILSLQENLEICEKHEHMYNTMTQAIKNNPELENEFYWILGIKFMEQIMGK